MEKMNEPQSPNAKAGLTYRCNKSIGCAHAHECQHSVAHRPTRIGGRAACNRKRACPYEPMLVVRCRQWWKEEARRERYFAEGNKMTTEGARQLTRMNLVGSNKDEKDDHIFACHDAIRWLAQRLDEEIKWGHRECTHDDCKSSGTDCPANAEGESRAVARTLHPLVGSLDGDK
jgi:hypothetical protein